MSYTKGPWRVNLSNDCSAHEIYGDRPQTPHEVCKINHYGYSKENEFRSEEQTANAHLIAAAPELLAMLTEISRDMDVHKIFDIHPYQTIMRNLIKKARGDL